MFKITGQWTFLFISRNAVSVYDSSEYMRMVTDGPLDCGVFNFIVLLLNILHL